MNKTVANLESRLLALIARGVDRRTTDGEFDRIAREVFSFQYARNGPYQAFCERMGRTPATVTHWTGIPAAPARAFKEMTLTCFPVAETVAEFHTSGTTQARAGRHLFRTLALYEAAIRPNFAGHLLPDGARLPMRVLTPSPANAPRSSLSHMMGVVLRDFGGPGSAFVNQVAPTDQPVFLLGTAFEFLSLFDQGVQLHLPAGSRAMETGGFKGRTREISKPELHALFEKQLGIPATHVVNEYGMTELSTQFYDETLRRGRPTDVKIPPPWARVIVVAPQTGTEAAHGERGLLRIFDLANLWSVLCVQTEDWGAVTDDGGFLILGRATGAEPRGCSLNTESLMHLA